MPKKYKKKYFLYVGLTTDEPQIGEAVKAYEAFAQVIGLKLYASQSTGNLGVESLDSQRLVYRALAEAKYEGVLAVHCEKESCFKPHLWNPQMPLTHAYARPEVAEIESVRDQIALAGESGFGGILHICHISSSDAVLLVDKERKTMRITCGVTPHHLLWNESKLREPDGLLYKMNPPLRSAASVKELREQLQRGKIDWIESDHAPHAREEKLGPPYASGYPSLTLYKDLIEEFLPSLGITKKQISSLTDGNIRKAFGRKLHA